MSPRDRAGALVSAPRPQQHSQVSIASYAALGDSFTAGSGCERGEGWADRLAAGLAAARGGELAYRNFAVHGATSADLSEQLQPALRLEPDLVTVICGANDLLYGSSLDAAAYARNLERILGGLRRALSGVRIVTATAPERWDFLPLRPRTLARVQRDVAVINEATRLLAASYGAELLDVARHPGLSDAENFSEDGLHPSAIGHARAADELATLIQARFGIRVDQEALR